MQNERVRQRNSATYSKGPICYWMDREERMNDNWALLYAQELAKTHGTHVIVVFNLVKDYLGGSARQFLFKVSALKELEQTFHKKNIPFYILLTDNSTKELEAFFQKKKVGAVVTDFNPLRINQTWRKTLDTHLKIPFYEVDAHNVVPCWIASDKKEFAAHTLRPKIHKQLKTFLTDFPSIRKQTGSLTLPKNPWAKIEKTPVGDRATPVDWIKPGEHAAKAALKSFLKNRLKGYADKRNDPNADALSNLSPYFHYGQLAPQRVAWEIKKSDAPLKDREAYLEELIVRRELADNFCYYEPKYDRFEGFHTWAQTTLNEHRNDKRAYAYTKRTFEQAKTHDELWNAAQMEMVKTGKMHGYMRMYWAKKILEWTKTPETALKIAIELNDAYELDGRDPNGYTGIAWSIGGIHDRAWNERPVFGKIRYMNANGCKRKFDTDTYIKRWLGGETAQMALD